MAYIDGFEHDIFISYAHVDDLTASEDEEGWLGEDGWENEPARGPPICPAMRAAGWEATRPSLVGREAAVEGIIRFNS